MRKMKVLLIAADIGHGHLRAAQAIKKVFTEMPHVEIQLIDYLHYCNPIFDDIWNSQGDEILDHFPAFSDWARKLADASPLHIRDISAQPRFESIYRERLDTFLLTKYLEKYQPDAVVCTFWYPCRIMAYLKIEGRTKAMLFGVVTGFACPLDFIWHSVDMYFVASEEVKDQMIQYGVSEERICVSGPPVDPIFNIKIDKNTVYETLGFCAELPTVLILCGGLDDISAKKLLVEVDQLPYKVQIIVVTGDDQRAEGWSSLKVSNPLKLFGYVDNMHELMEVCDVVVTKAGDSISAEAIAKGKPIVIAEPPEETLAPGRIHYIERKNAIYLLEAGAALQVISHKDSIYTCDVQYKLSQILMNRAKSEEMRDRIRAIAKPNATICIVRKIADSINR